MSDERRRGPRVARRMMATRASAAGDSVRLTDPADPLLTMDNVPCTPHIGNVTCEE